MSTSRNRLNLPAPVEPARKTAAEEVISEPEPEYLPKFRVIFIGTIYPAIYELLHKLIPTIFRNNKITN